MATYKPIQSIVLSTSASSVTFSDIPQDYSDLVLVCSLIFVGTPGGQSSSLQFNQDTGSNYSYTRLDGSESTVVSGRSANNTTIYLSGSGDGSTTTPSTTITHIANYANSNTNKTILSRGSWNGTTKEVDARVGLWRNTSAITNILVLSYASNFASGSTFDLYGIKSGAPSALGGDVVTTDGNYWYHTFNTTQTFTTLKPLTVDYLVVAGGGGGGHTVAGAGGAGGLRSTVTATGGGGSLESSLSLSSGTGYTVTVGSGGAGNTGGIDGTNGSNSVFSTITSTGGGGGAAYSNRNGLSGGSGGGGGGGETGTNSNGGTGTNNQGYAGGKGLAVSASFSGGGGGGAGAVGTNASASQGGNGGTGVAVSISGSSVTYAGGGGGGTGSGTFQSGVPGTGGSGGGGAGGSWSAGSVAATANTGGGGGGGGNNTGINGANGGSGVVIVRYPV
jgi:hypothetical protein